MPQRILALECDARELRAAVVESSFRDYRVIGFFREPLPEAADERATRLRNFVLKNGLGGATILSSMPGDQASLRTFVLPFADRTRLDQTVPFELETQVPFSLDDVIVDYQVLVKEKNGSGLLAALVQRADLENHLKLLADAGLDPKTVDLGPFAALNVLRLLGAADLPADFLVVFGTARRATVALYRERRLVGLRTLLGPECMPATSDGDESGDGRPPDDAERAEGLFVDLRWTIRAMSGTVLPPGFPCLLAAEGAEWERVAPRLESEMPFSVRRLEEASIRQLTAAQRSELSSYAAPLGLALREVLPSESVGLNFRRGDFAYHRGQEEVRRALWRTAAIAVVGILLLGASTYMEYRQDARRLELLEQQIRAVFSQTLPGVQRIVDAKGQLQAEIDAKQRELQVLGGVAPTGSTTAIDAMRTISSSIPDSVKIDLDEYIMDTDGIRARAKAESFEAVDLIKLSIEGTHYFADVQVKDVKAAADGKGVDFRIVMALQKGAEGDGGKP